MSIRKYIAPIILILLALTASSILLAQDEVLELTQNYDEGGITLDYPEDWFLLASGGEVYISNSDLEALQASGAESYPEDLVLMRLTTIPLSQIPDFEAGATAMDLAEYIEFENELEEIELNDKVFIRTDIGDDTVDAFVYITVLTDDIFGLFVANTPDEAMDAYQATIEAIIASVNFEIVAEIPEDSAERYKDIPMGFTEDGFPRLGDPDAPVTVLEISSFDCPHCANWHDDVFTQLIERIRAGEIQFIFVSVFGTGGIPNGEYAALSALCAAEQDAFWIYQDALFSWQQFGTTAFIEPRLIAGIEALDIDMEEWQTCYDDEASIEKLLGFYQYAQGVPDFRGTPTVLVNGVMVVSSIESVNEAIDTALEAE